MNAFCWAILAALVWGVVPLIEKAGLQKVEPLVGLFYRCLGVFIGLIILGVFILKPHQIKSINPRSMVYLILGGFMASLIGQFCFYHSLKTGEVSRVVPVAGSFPLIAFILGILLFGESISAIKIAGMALIVVGIWALHIG